MQAMRHFRLELRHATMPTYVASYLFPFLLFVYETHRVGRWTTGCGFYDAAEFVCEPRQAWSFDRRSQIG
ncbi:hypothetical protein [Paraburkholderia elongata]|uniref:Uncharacterized protein n=1 Tax=Paraburkholderia elongata TaxID=2675747 RepID=A0A972NM44_9BURK|nr:hypothetical protein [Paraburkholderia elongata]NPT56096.1 hypothetical protein [Paraburkholderia elongata]